MATIDPKEVQRVLDEIAGLERDIKTAGDSGRAQMLGLNLDNARQSIPTQNAAVDAAAWSALDQSDQNSKFQRLRRTLDELRFVAGMDGPTDPKHIMYGAYASNGAIYGSAVFAVVLIAALLFAIWQRWEKATGTDFAANIQIAVGAITELDTATALDEKTSAALVAAQQAALQATEAGKDAAQQNVKTQEREAVVSRAKRESAQAKANGAALDAVRKITKGGATEANVLTMVILLGALGSALHLIGSLTKYVGNRQFKRSWLLYYWLTPFSGAALAPLFYMLLRIGLISPSGAPNGGTTIANLNLIAIYAFAGLTGLFAKTATDKLAEIFKTAFRSSDTPTKDSIGGERPPGSAKTS